MRFKRKLVDGAGRIEFDALATPFALLTTAAQDTWELVRGACLDCGAEVGIAFHTERVNPPIVFDGIAGPDEVADLEFVPHSCRPGPTDPCGTEGS